MRNWLSQLTRVRYEYPDPTQYESARTLTIVSLTSMVLAVLAALALIVAGPADFTGVSSSLLPGVGAALLALLVIYVLVQMGLEPVASALFVASLVAAAYVSQSGRSLTTGPNLIMWALPVVVAGQLLRTRYALLVAVVCLTLSGYLGVSEWQSLPADERLALSGETAFSVGVLAVVLLGIVFVDWLFVSRVLRRLRDAVRRATLLRAMADVSQSATEVPDLHRLLSSTVERISRAFGYYQTQIYLLDESGTVALLRASTGAAGRQLVERGHHLDAGGQSVVGQAIRRGETTIAAVGPADSVRAGNEQLANTRSEMALPLRVGDRIVGALDVQSVDADAFGVDEIETLQILANQLAAAIENVRLLDELSARAAENESLLEQTRANLQQIEALNRMLTRQGWRDYVRRRTKGSSYGYSLHGEALTEESNWTPPMRRAFDEQRTVLGSGSRDRPDTLSVPLRIRGEMIGVLEVQRDEGQVWTEDEVELADALAERLSLALDNALLLEQADTLARREVMVNEISQNVQSAANVDELLQSALLELGRALGASRGVVQLSPRKGAGSDGGQGSALAVDGERSEDARS